MNNTKGRVESRSKKLNFKRELSALEAANLKFRSALWMTPKRVERRYRELNREHLK